MGDAFVVAIIIAATDGKIVASSSSVLNDLVNCFTN